MLPAPVNMASRDTTKAGDLARDITRHFDGTAVTASLNAGLGLERDDCYADPQLKSHLIESSELTHQLRRICFSSVLGSTRLECVTWTCNILTGRLYAV